ncbi:MAG: hypothetical protein Q4E42_03830 [Phascolarctobacterium sp.]|nr:hypothetical protein [Phascolarctobacterium sp.]
MKIEKIDLKKKVMLALLAGNLLCSANALAANTYVLNGGSPVEFDATSGYDPTAFNKTGNTIVFNIQEEYGDHSADPVVVPTFPLTGALDMTGDFVTLSGHDVTMNVEAGVYVVQNACAAVAQKGIVRDNKLTVNGGIFFTNNDLIGSGIIGIAAGYSMDGDVINNKAFITGVTCGVAGAGYTASDGGKAYNNVLTVTDCTISQFLVGAAAMEEPLSPAFGGNVQHNKLIINGNSQISAWVYGGISRGTVTNPLPAIDNSVEINGGTFSRYIYGVETTSEAVENYVIINNGTINDAVKGACVKASATGNYVIVNGGTFARTNPNDTISIFGGEVDDGSPNGSFAKKNYVILNGGTFKNAQVYGAINRAENGIAGSDSATGDPNDGNWVTINNATFNYGIDNKIYGASTSGTAGKAYNNKVTINNGTFTGAADFSLKIAGGKADHDGTASNNSVNINNGTFIAAGAGEITIIGGDAVGDANNNSVTIKNGVFQGAKIIGGRAENVTGNKVIIDGGTFNGTNDNKIYGAYLISGIGISNNEVVLNGGIFSKATIIAADGSASYPASGNKITIAGSNALDLSGATLMGYENTFTYGTEDRTLNVARTNVAVKDIQNFGTINFNLDGASSDAIVLKMDGSFDVSTLNSVNINITNSSLTGNDYIVLMQNVTGDYGGSSTGIMKLGNDLIYYTGTQPATQKGDYTIKQDNGTKVWHETTINGTYSFTTDIKGNVNKSPEGLVDTSYSGNEVIIRRGTYENDIYGVYYTGTDGKDMNNNSITVHGGTFHSASGLYYGGLWAVHTRGTGNFTGNVITINAGDFKNGDSASIYAVYGMNISGSSTNNSIVINGGNINTNKHIVAVYAGGTANGNTITINGGTIGSNDASPWLYICGVYLYSGAGNTISGNEVNVNAGSFVGSMDIAGVSVGNYAGANTYSGNKVNISGGSFDLTYVTDGKINIYGIYRNGSVTAANNNSVIIANAQFNLDDANDEVNVYGASVGSGNVEHNSVELHDGKFHRVAGGWIINNGNANYNELTIESGTFAGGYDIYAGYVGANGNVVGNKIIINGGDVGDSKEIDAGYIHGDGDATGNIITINGGIIGSDNAVNIYGAEVKNGSATGNKVNITGGTFGKYVTIKGAILWQDNLDAEISGNEVNITGGTFDYKISIYGGHASSGTAKLVENNKVTIKNISVANESTIYGGNATDTLVKENGVIIENATLSDSIVIYGGYTGSKDAEGNFVTLKSSTFGDGTEIYGAYTNNGNAGGDTEDKGNKVIIDGGSFGTGSAIYGGYVYSSGNANYNKITINTGTFNNSNIGAGNTDDGNSNGNTVIVNDGNFEGYSSGSGIWSGYVVTGSGSTNENKIYINGGTFGDNISFWGAYGSSGEAKDNIVEIAGGTFGNNFGLYGGYTTGTSTNNTLNLKIKMGGKASEVSHFQNMNFTLPSNITNGDIMLETASVIYDNTTIGVTAANGVKLNKDDVIYLVKADNINSTTIANDEESVLNGAAIVKLDGNDLILTLLQDFEQKKTAGNEDQQKAPVEGIAAAMQTVNMSADLASGQGMSSLLANTAGGTTDTFGAMSAGSSKYKTGSHVDVDGWGLLVGVGKTKEWGNGEATTLGVFFEYGKGDFDTYNGNVHGDGNSKNQGIGIMMRHKMLNNTYYEGNIRYGKQTTEWSESELGSYDTDSKYYGIMVGMGHIFPAGKNEIDVYGRYTFGHVGACDATVGDSHYNFESVKSHRVRIGGKYNFKLKDSNAKPYVGLAWEHEFKGEARASISGVGEAPAPSMKGHTGIMEVGCDWKVSKKWTVGLGANAYIGKRKGWDGMARVFYNF